MIKALPSFRTFRFRLRKAGGDYYIEIDVNAQTVSGIDGIPVRLPDLVFYSDQIRSAFQDYSYSKRNRQDLGNLIDRCSLVYSWFKQEVLKGRARTEFEQFIKHNRLDGTVIFESRDFIFPIDLLYVRAPGNDLTGLGFLGLHMAVSKRMLTNDEEVSANTLLRGDYMIAFVGSPHYKGATRELKALRRTMREAWKTRLVSIDTGIQCVQNVLDLWTSKHQFDIVHFSAHLGRATGVPKIQLGNGVILEPVHFSLLADHQVSPKFVVMNTCSAAVASPTEPTGFLKTLYPRYAAGFLATEFNVRDRIASELLENFYALFLGGEPVGSALRTMQKHLAKRDLSVLAYSLFNVNTDLCLEVI